MVKPWIPVALFVIVATTVPGLETNSSPGCFGNMTISLLLVP